MKISFAHNVYDRPQRLAETIKIEKEIFPDANIYVAYNNNKIDSDILKNKNITQSAFFPQSTHKIGCVNGAYLSINLALQNNPDIIIFSHDDVFISNPEVVKKHVESIISGKYDFIARIPKNLKEIGTNYMMMEAMFFSLKAAQLIYGNFKAFTNELDIERDLRGSISPEVNMYNIVTKALPQKSIDIHFYDQVNDLQKYNETLNMMLGFTHHNAGMRAWKE